jgi:hypothetical protein
MPYTLIATGYPINTFVPNSTTLPTVTDRGLFLDTTLLAAMQTAAAANKVPLVLTGLTVAGLPPAPGRYTASDKFVDRFDATFGQALAAGEEYGDLRAEAGRVYQFTLTGPWTGVWVAVGMTV